MLPRDYQANPSEANPDVEKIGVQYERDAGAGYGEHIRDTTAVCNSSASHTYGNVLGIVEKFILDIFPPDLFKTVTASTSLANRQTRHLPHQLHKQEQPLMVLVPRIMFGQDDNRFLANTIINSRMTNTHAIWGEGSLIPLAKDMKKQLYVHGHYNRAVMYVDIVMSFQTYSQQINAMSYLHNVIPVGHNQFITAPLELYIPGRFCELISDVAKIPIDENGSVSNFLSYMNSISYHPITYKLNGGTNTNEFFMYYLADVDILIQDPQLGAGVKDGQVRRNFELTFTVRCEFNTVGYFTLNAPNVRRQVITPDTGDATIVPLFSDVINLDDFKLPIGWQVMGWPIFKLKEGESSISLQPILNQSLNAVIDYHLRNSIPMNKFIRIQFRENGQILNHEMFYIDWHARVLTLTKPNYRRTYRLIITVSPDYINSLIKQIYNLE